jgi:hypothetical protein
MPSKGRELIVTETLDCKLTVVSWTEVPRGEFDNGDRLAQGEIELVGSGDGVESARINVITYYRSDRTTAYVLLMRLSGTVAGRRGTVMLKGHGTYDGTAFRNEYSVVPRSGVGEWTGIAGAAASISADDEFPSVSFVFRFSFGAQWKSNTNGHWIAREFWSG